MASIRLCYPALSRTCAVRSTGIISGNILPQHQQSRSRWTKAKKKRFARHERNQNLETAGITPPRPSYYTPRDTPVILPETKPSTADGSQDVTAALQAAVRNSKERPPLRHHMDDSALIMSDRVRQLFALQNGNQREVIQAQKQQGMAVFQQRPGDTGSSAVQVLALTTRIQQIQAHMQQHPKDKHSKRGMDALYVRRRKLLDYMERKDFDNYRIVVKTLGLIRK